MAYLRPDKVLSMNWILFAIIPGGYELIVIVFVILLLFGGRKIPELMRGLGKGIREFNTAKSSIENEIKEGMREGDKEQKKQNKEESSSNKTE